mmetsp:Transcript_40294/g.72110  ORF Transcript_40294/g.72110 Transcript_40294/m.72110 type:complete len:432 (-) Transcript_40294:122-1417(-)
MLKALAGDSAKGIKKADFHRVRIQIGVARERAKDLKRKKAREAREAEIEEMKEAFKKKLADLEKRLAGADETIKKVEEDSKPMHLQAKDMTSVEMLAFAEKMELQIKEAKSPLEALKADISNAKEGAEEEIATWLNTQVRLLDARFSRLEPRLGLQGSACLRFRESAKTKARAELKALENRARAMLRYQMKANDLTADGLAESIEGDGDTVSEASFLKFFKSCKEEPAAENGEKACPPSDEDLARLYKQWADESDGVVQKETLVCHVRRYMKVVKVAALTDSKGVKDSKSIRRLQEGEVVEALGPEQFEEEVELMRLKVKAMKDGAEGWVTISGNQGTVFLKEGGHSFKVVKETILTESFSLDGAGSKEASRRLRDEPRKLKPGELVEVRTWMMKDEKSGLMRMKCKTMTDGVVGWATVVGNAGTVFLEVN